MTAVKDPGIGESKWRLYQDVLAEGSLTVRVFVLWGAGKTLDAARELIDRVSPSTKPYVSTGDDLLVSGGVSSMQEGVALAAETIDSGSARATLDELVRVSTCS